MTDTPDSPPTAARRMWNWMRDHIAGAMLVTLLFQPIALRLGPAPVVPVDCTSYVMTISNIDASHVELDEQRLALAFDERTVRVCGTPAEVLLALEPRRGP